MSWSLCFNGKLGIVTDTYERLPLLVELCGAEDEASACELELMKRLYERGFRSFCFRLVTSGEGLVVNIAGMLRSLNSYLEVLRTFSVHKPVVAIIFPHTGDQALLAALILDCTPFQILVVDYAETGVTDKGALLDMYTTFRDTVNASLTTTAGQVAALGFAGISKRSTLQYLFDNVQPGDIRVCIAGNVSFPNLNARNIDYIHSRGANSLFLLAAEVLVSPTAKQIPTIGPLLSKYPQCLSHPGPLLVKCLLQYGQIVCIPMLRVPEEFLVSHISCILHPFSIRKEFSAPTKTLRFVVENADVDAILELSEEHESKEDAAWTKECLHTKPSRALSDFNSLLAEKKRLKQKFVFE